MYSAWDKVDPKGGTVILKRWEDYTGNKAALKTEKIS